MFVVSETRHLSSGLCQGSASEFGEQVFCCSLLCKPNKLFQSMPELRMLHNDLQTSMMEHFGFKIFLSIKLPVPVNVNFGPST